MRWLQPSRPDAFDAALPRALGRSAAEVADDLDEADARAAEQAACKQRRLQRKADASRMYRRDVVQGRA